MTPTTLDFCDHSILTSPPPPHPGYPPSLSLTCCNFSYYFSSFCNVINATTRTTPDVWDRSTQQNHHVSKESGYEQLNYADYMYSLIRHLELDVTWWLKVEKAENFIIWIYTASIHGIVRQDKFQARMSWEKNFQGLRIHNYKSDSLFWSNILIDIPSVAICEVC